MTELVSLCLERHKQRRSDLITPKMEKFDQVRSPRIASTLTWKLQVTRNYFYHSNMRKEEQEERSKGKKTYKRLEEETRPIHDYLCGCVTFLFKQGKMYDNYTTWQIISTLWLQFWQKLIIFLIEQGKMDENSTGHKTSLTIWRVIRITWLPFWWQLVRFWK